MNKIILALLILSITTNLYALTTGEKRDIIDHLKVQARITKDVQELLNDWGDHRIDTELALKKLRQWKNKYNRIDPRPEMKKTHRLYNKFLSQIEDILIDMERTGGTNNASLKLKAIATSREIEREVTGIKYLAK